MVDTEFEHADESPGLLLWQVTNHWQAAQRAALIPYDLTYVQYILLVSLAWLTARPGKKPVIQRDVADRAATDPMMTSQVLRALEKKGLLQRSNHPTDHRAKCLTPTPSTAALANQATTATTACNHTFFTALGDRTSSFTTALHRLRDHNTAISASG